MPSSSTSPSKTSLRQVIHLLQYLYWEFACKEFHRLSELIVLDDDGGSQAIAEKKNGDKVTGLAS